MWIVIFGDKTRHSAWNSRKEAIEQVKVLADNRIIKPIVLSDFVYYDDTVTCENGHYYV